MTRLTEIIAANLDLIWLEFYGKLLENSKKNRKEKG